MIADRDKGHLLNESTQSHFEKKGGMKEVAYFQASEESKAD